MPTRASTFENTRVRFQRLSDARLFHGWVSMMSPKRVVVNSPDAQGLIPGGKFHFEVQGQGEVAMFAALLVGASEHLYEFELTSAMRSIETAVDMRLKVRDLIASVREAPVSKPGEAEAAAAPDATDCHVVDLSSQGMGLLSPQPFRTGSQVEVVLVTPLGPVTGFGVVRYCKPEKESHRLGIALKSMERLDRGRYSFFLQGLSS